ncbi:hypothetical protein DIPPA_06983 [Diplonema papillatum]|nr:hypothetical protein DIPPA_06983 [Diplonema papillatum]
MERVCCAAAEAAYEWVSLWPPGRSHRWMTLRSFLRVCVGSRIGWTQPGAAHWAAFVGRGCWPGVAALAVECVGAAPRWGGAWDGRVLRSTPPQRRRAVSLPGRSRRIPRSSPRVCVGARVGALPVPVAVPPEAQVPRSRRRRRLAGPPPGGGHSGSIRRHWRSRRHASGGALRSTA